MSDVRGHVIVTAVLPGRDPARWGPVAARCWPTLRPLVCRDVQARLPHDAGYFRVDDDDCNCATALGSAHAVVHGEAQDQKQVRALRLRGWTQSKIQRWLEQRAAARDPEELARRRARELAGWMAALHALLGEGGCAQVGLIVHQYRVSLEREHDVFTRQVHIARRDISLQLLGELPHDVLALFDS
jgi:hypothetical protein